MTGSRSLSCTGPGPRPSSSTAGWSGRSPTPTPSSGCGPPATWPPPWTAPDPSAAASAREGLEEMFTVRRLGISESLERTLTTPQPDLGVVLAGLGGALLP